jgi:hypothetical protein
MYWLLSIRHNSCFWKQWTKQTRIIIQFTFSPGNIYIWEHVLVKNRSTPVTIRLQIFQSSELQKGISCKCTSHVGTWEDRSSTTFERWVLSFRTVAAVSITWQGHGEEPGRFCGWGLEAGAPHFGSEVTGQTLRVSSQRLLPVSPWKISVPSIPDFWSADETIVSHDCCVH